MTLAAPISISHVHGGDPSPHISSLPACLPCFLPSSFFPLSVHSISASSFPLHCLTPAFTASQLDQVSSRRNAQKQPLLLGQYFSPFCFTQPPQVLRFFGNSCFFCNFLRITNNVNKKANTVERGDLFIPHPYPSQSLKT